MPKGRKTCPKCKTPVPCRLKVCECGHDFYGGSSKTASQPSRTIPPPSQRCPTPSAKTAESSSSIPPMPKRRLPAQPKRRPSPASGSSPAKKPYLVVKATDPRKIAIFRRALGVAVKQSLDNGGLYSVFLEVDQGTLQVEVQTFSGHADDVSHAGKVNTRKH